MKAEIAVLIMYGQAEISAVPVSEFVNNTRSAQETVQLYIIICHILHSA